MKLEKRCCTAKLCCSASPTIVLIMYSVCPETSVYPGIVMESLGNGDAIGAASPSTTEDGAVSPLHARKALQRDYMYLLW